LVSCAEWLGCLMAFFPCVRETDWWGPSLVTLQVEGGSEWLLPLQKPWGRGVSQGKQVLNKALQPLPAQGSVFCSKLLGLAGGEQRPGSTCVGGLASWRQEGAPDSLILFTVMRVKDRKPRRAFWLLGCVPCLPIVFQFLSLLGMFYSK
jgi:hypothetical protein